MKSSKIFTKGILDVLPLLIPVVPFGLIIGVIGIELGFSPLMVYATSLIVFSGSAQIVFFQLISGGASPIVTLTSVGVTNSRHLLYGAVLSEYLENLSTTWKIFLSYFLVDQSFALSNKFFKENTDNSIPAKKGPIIQATCPEVIKIELIFTICSFANSIGIKDCNAG